MEINNFKEMYFAELSELHSAESQLVDALSTMADTARHDGLKQAFAKHREQTQSQRDRVASVLKAHDVNPNMHQDQAMAKLIGEAEKMMGILKSPDLTDAGLIASAQKIEHYEIAGYGTAATYAELLGFKDDMSTLHQIMEEEKATDERLTLLAQEVVNKDAVGRP